MTPTELDQWSNHWLSVVEDALSQWVSPQAPAGLGEAMRYAVLDGGKRLRPLLVLAAREAVAHGHKNSALDEAALRAACAVELIHAYSLVHDDMPCMDNDVLRRGKPTVHVQFGEAQALLAGDALQALAFEFLTPDGSAIPDNVQARLCRLLATSAGHAGMAGGQAIDLASVGVALTEDQLRHMHRLKTGALLEGSVMMGAACGETTPQAMNGLKRYGQALGLAFQVVDDILDVIADSATLGKTAGKDAANDKPTYVSLLGLEEAKSYAQSLLREALDALHSTGLTHTHTLAALADELRSYLLHSVAKTGGHLSSNLGTVELTVALHYVFNTPHDRIVWDVGHQTYPHKILTGRRDQMHTLRQRHGLSGFPKRDESEFDAFGTAHSSTSISAALGMAIAAQQKGEQRHAIAVIGDGAMTAGMAFEALNNGGVSTSKLLVILNDNDMSISPPVGALNRYLAQLMSGKFYSAAKEVGKQVLKGAPPLFELAKRFEEHAKGMVVPATLFEKFGFNYIGPIDGHDLESLIPTLENLKHLDGPQFLHVVTKKGQGYKLAEADPVAYHGPGKFDPAVGLQPAAASKTTFTQVFGDWLCDMAEHDPLLVGITPAMREGSGMVEFHKRFPERYHDVGIAEQHAVTFAAGLACEGLKPVVAIYSTFLQRAYDQVIHDVALQKLPMVLALDRSGIVGADGPTHAGLYDIPFMRCIPNVSVACPADENECRQLLTTAYQQDHCVAVRYPRGAGVGVPVQAGLQALSFGKGEVRREGKRIAILAFGTMLYPALQAGEALNATVVNMRWAKPLDTELLAKIAASHDALVTVEEGAIMGGAGSAVLEALQELQLPKPVLVLGIADVFTDHGDPVKLLTEMGLDAAGIQASIEKRFATLLN